LYKVSPARQAADSIEEKKLAFGRQRNLRTLSRAPQFALLQGRHRQKAFFSQETNAPKATLLHKPLHRTALTLSPHTQTRPPPSPHPLVNAYRGKPSSRIRNNNQAGLDRIDEIIGATEVAFMNATHPNIRLEAASPLFKQPPLSSETRVGCVQKAAKSGAPTQYKALVICKRSTQTGGGIQHLQLRSISS
jgi:hypothetical protein